jgi:hypothetical protein
MLSIILEKILFVNGKNNYKSIEDALLYISTILDFTPDENYKFALEETEFVINFFD